MYDGGRVRAKTGVENRLAAADLVPRKRHLDAMLAQDADARLANLRVKQIDETGDKQGRAVGRHRRNWRLLMIDLRW